MIKKYQFGHSKIEIRMPENMRIPQNMSLFELETTEVEKVYELRFTDDLKQIEDKFRKENNVIREICRKNMCILVSEYKEGRILNFEGISVPYAVCIEESLEYSCVWISEQIQDLLTHDTIFVSLLGLEKVVLNKNAMILHSAYMLRDGKAILFSAPSETGKSTQAKLWEEYRDTRTINGDRSLLIREEDGWYAHGWPICGNSKICYNECYPIQAIIMLHQAKENEVQRLGVAESVKKLMSQVTINMWNREFQMKAIDLIQQLAMEVSVFELGCDISENAVRCLERVL